VQVGDFYAIFRGDGDDATPGTQDGNRDGIKSSSDGLGIQNNILNENETLFINFATDASGTTPVEVFDVSFMVGNMDQGDQVVWTAYLNNVEVATGTFTAGPVNSSINNPVDLNINTAFDNLTITAPDTAENTSLKFVDMTVSRSLFTAGEDLNFNVAFTDSDGDAASTTLPITIVATDATGYHFTGTADADAMQGSNVVDFMTGGLGKDVMTGDTGNDTFVFQSAADSSSDLALSDVITDFQVGDKIDLSAIDANTGVGGDQAFAFGGNNPNAVANSVTWSVSGGNTIVHIDNTGDTTADMQIILNGVLSLDASKFTL